MGTRGSLGILLIGAVAVSGLVVFSAPANAEATSVTAVRKRGTNDRLRSTAGTRSRTSDEGTHNTECD